MPRGIDQRARGICVNHHCRRFEYPVPADDGDACADCGQDLCHESGLTFADAREKRYLSAGLRCDCGAAIVEQSIEREYARSAPEWQGWPAPPPETMVEQIPVRDWITELCADGHVVRHTRAIT